MSADEFAELKAEFDRITEGKSSIDNLELAALAQNHADSIRAFEALCRYADEKGIEPSGERYE